MNNNLIYLFGMYELDTDSIIVYTNDSNPFIINCQKYNSSVILENPDDISKLILAKGLDAGTAFEILSIDIADIDIGKNIGAELQTDQAEADLKIAQAKAEERRAMAVATEQEMRAKTQDMQAKVVEAQAEVPKALAEAFRNGNLGVMDYYNMNNIIADTKMRENLADSE